MKAKNFTFLFAGILAIILLTSFASATLSFSNIPTLSQSASSTTISITSTEDETVSFTIDDITIGSDIVTFDPISDVVLTADTAEQITIDYNIPSGTDFGFNQVHSTTLTASGEISDDKTQSLSFASTTYCGTTPSNGLKINIEDIKVVNGFGDDDSYWYPLDEIEFEVTVENNGNEDLNNIEIEWELYDEDDNLMMDGDESDFDLKEDKDEVLTITFTLDDDVDEFNAGEWTLYIRAQGEGEDSDDMFCASDSKSVDMNIDNDFVILADIKYSEALCGSTITVEADVWNIGEDDQDEVSVRFFIDEFKFSKTIEVGDIDTLEKESIEVTIEIPEDAQPKTYHLRAQVYDEDNDVYQNDEDDDSEYDLPLVVSGSCQVTPTALVSATLESDAIAGKDLIVKVTVTNTGDESATYNLKVAGYADWASEVKVDSSVMILNAGESKDATITLKVNKKIEGDRLFDIELVSDGDLIVKQPVSVTITDSGFSFPLTGGAISSDNWYLWGIGALNIILVIIIVVVAIRIARS